MTEFETLTLRNVTRVFDEVTALDQLSLEVQNGEFIALLGPSGCGKSTALNCLAGLLPLTGGEILIDHTRIDLMPPERRRFGMVFQNYALFPHMTVRANIGFGLQMQSVKRSIISEKVDWALNLVQLEDHAEKRPDQLSGGQQQRVAIARAVVMEPRLVLMDEPLSNLDAKLRHEMRRELRRLHKELGLTTIYVTHDQEEALSMADRIVLLRKGRVQQLAEPETIYRSPANAFVAGFMGYRNTFDMRSQRNANDTVVRNEHLSFTTKTDISGDVTVAIRPDDFQIEPLDKNRIQGHVVSCDFQGREYEVMLEIAPGKGVLARVAESLKVGSTASLYVPKDRVMVYERAADETADRSFVDVGATA